MLGSLCLLLLALGIVLWHNRDFWFPDGQDAESDQPAESSPAPLALRSQVEQAAQPEGKSSATTKLKGRPAPAARRLTAAASTSSESTMATGPAISATSRTVLPPLEVEVVAGDSHRTLRPGSNSVQVDLQPGTQPETNVEAASTVDNEPAANVTNNAAEHVQMSANTSEIVTQPVRPNYPLLARQMKVQGSVILQALIGKDGIIQNLRVVSGPRILASAAQDAVRQWHFKPHFEGSEAVETQAKITVNFTISTN